MLDETAKQGDQQDPTERPSLPDTQPMETIKDPDEDSESSDPSGA